MERRKFLGYMGKGLFFGSASLYLPSCSKFLEEKPKAILSPNTFFNSDKAARAAINGIYEIYHNNALYGNVTGLNASMEFGADTVGPNRTWGSVEQIQNYTIDEGTTNTRTTWQHLYNVIYNTNLILNKITDNKKMTPEGIDQAMGEALFLRSLAYFHLTNLWGDAPFYTEFIPLSEIQVLPRTDKDKIRTQIVTDLQKAKELLPDSYPESELGRATKWAAATLLTKVYLWMKNWQGARDTAVDIINNSPHKLLENYADVFDPNNEGNAELIFQIVFAKDLEKQRRTDNYCPRLRDEPKKSSEKSALKKALDARNEGFTGYGLDIPLTDLVEKYPMNDLRRPSNIITNYLGFELSFPYFPKMWNLDQINSPRGNHGENYIVFRLADVYLMAAEAENELSGPANAFPYINKVRERAYDPPQPIIALTQAQFRKALQDERKWELAAEGYRRMDLIRWGILLETVKNTHYRVYDPAKNISPRNVLLPIPATELQLNPNLLKSDPTNNGYR